MSLHPEVKHLLQELYASGWKSIATLTVAEARKQFDTYAQMRKFPKLLPNTSKKDFKLHREKESIELRVYQPEVEQCNAAVIFYHGGGFVLSSFEHYDVFCHWMCTELGVTVLSVNYRLAPENPFPTPIEDAYFALEWIVAHSDELLINGKQLVVSGDSSGAHLASMVSILSRDRAGPKINWQWLIYPWLDNSFSYASYQTFAEGYLLETATMKWFDKHFLNKQVSMPYPAYPFQVENLSNLPKAYIISAEYDPLRDEAEMYSKKLQAAGNCVYYECALSMIHGFLNQYAIPASFKTSMDIFNSFKNKLSSI